MHEERERDIVVVFTYIYIHVCVCLKIKIKIIIIMFVRYSPLDSSQLIFPASLHVRDESMEGAQIRTMRERQWETHPKKYGGRGNRERVSERDDDGEGEGDDEREGEGKDKGVDGEWVREKAWEMIPKKWRGRRWREASATVKISAPIFPTSNDVILPNFF